MMYDVCGTTFYYECSKLLYDSQLFELVIRRDVDKVAVEKCTRPDCQLTINNFARIGLKQ